MEFVQKNAILKGIDNMGDFYFVQPTDESIILGETTYGKKFCSMICKDNIYATQFHLEKSGPLGLLLLKNFSCIVDD